MFLGLRLVHLERNRLSPSQPHSYSFTGGGGGSPEGLPPPSLVRNEGRVPSSIPLGVFFAFLLEMWGGRWINKFPPLELLQRLPKRLLS